MPICARWWGLKVLFKKKNKLVVLSWALKPTGYLRNTCSHCFPTFSFWSSFLTQTMIILTYYPTHTTIRILFRLGSPFLSFLSIFHSLFAHNIDKHNQKKSFQRTVFSGTPLHILAKVITTKPPAEWWQTAPNSEIELILHSACNAVPQTWKSTPNPLPLAASSHTSSAPDRTPRIRHTRI